MLVHTIPGIDNWDVEMRCQQLRSTRQRVSDHDRVRSDGAQRVASVQQRFAFFNTGATGLHKRGDCAQGLGRYFERSPGAGRGFVEEEHHAFAAQ